MAFRRGKWSGVKGDGGSVYVDRRECLAFMERVGNMNRLLLGAVLLRVTALGNLRFHPPPPPHHHFLFNLISSQSSSRFGENTKVEFETSWLRLMAAMSIFSFKSSFVTQMWKTLKYISFTAFTGFFFFFARS